ncbi:MAG: branched-chain amino acid aminotransferase [Caenispirillum sp.]|nr:branched-chain amino acid aminotransferase [Caenispirillum sp.]
MTFIPFDARDGLIWMDGEMVPWRDAKVHVLTHALHYASAVFEGSRAYGGRVFRMTDHNVRLHRSAELLGFSLPYSVETLDAATQEVVAASGGGDLYLRHLAWRGSEMMGVAAQKNRIHVAIAAWEWPSYFKPEERMAGIRLMWAPWRRPAPETAPSASKAAGLYMICTLSKHQAENEGWHDALMLDYKGRLAEATGANLFLVIDGELHTPVPECILDGITRRTVMDLARRAGITVVERELWPDDLDRAQEVFLTGSAAEVTPVGQIADRRYTPGAVTRLLMDAYSAAVRAPAWEPAVA